MSVDDFAGLHVALTLGLIWGVGLATIIFCATGEGCHENIDRCGYDAVRSFDASGKVQAMNMGRASTVQYRGRCYSWSEFTKLRRQEMIDEAVRCVLSRCPTFFIPPARHIPMMNAFFYSDVRAEFARIAAGDG